jgi:hypothetical protein
VDKGNRLLVLYTGGTMGMKPDHNGALAPVAVSGLVLRDVYARTHAHITMCVGIQRPGLPHRTDPDHYQAESRRPYTVCGGY